MKKKQKKGYKISNDVKEKLKAQDEIKKQEKSEKIKKPKAEKKKGKFKFSKFFETVFCIAYLGFLYFCIGKFFSLARSNKVYIVMGCLTFSLAFGDSFHLFPRILNNLKKNGIDYKDFWFGLGNQISSITITWFYLLLYFVYKIIFPNNPPHLAFEIGIWVTVILRVFICLLPQNKWFDDNRSLALSIIRNLIFLVTGIMEIVLFALIGNKGGFGLWMMSIAIGLSFLFYLPVAFGAKKHPKLGMLMIPKTLCYVWMMVMLLNIIGKV